MRYKNLKNFAKIFDRSDFYHISDPGIIDGISKIIINNLNNPDGKEGVHSRIVHEYLNNLEYFCRWIGGDIKNIKKAYSICEEELVKVMKLFREPAMKRKAISRRYLRRFNKNFLRGLSKLLKGIRKAFDDNLVGKTNITQKQFVKYIFDKEEGLGNRFLFNTKGKHAFARKISYLDKKELIVTVRLLLRPKGNQVRTFNGWRDLGLGHTPVRVLAQRRLFGKLKVFYLYKLAEHRDYERQLQTPPDECVFFPL